MSLALRLFLAFGLTSSMALAGCSGPEDSTLSPEEEPRAEQVPTRDPEADPAAVDDAGSADASMGEQCLRLRVMTPETSINVRPDPSTANPPVAALPDGQVVERLDKVVGENVSGDTTWYKIKAPTVTGYVFAAGVSCTRDALTPAPPPKPTTGFGLPFPAGKSYTITQSPLDPFSHNDNYNRHAVDFSMPNGSELIASADGVVYFEGFASGGGGIMVMLDHGNNRCSQYAHMSQTIIDNGNTIKRGQLIGYSGATGYATGPHLHWNMVNCDSQTSREIINTDELGTKYAEGSTATSTNVKK